MAGRLKESGYSPRWKPDPAAVEAATRRFFARVPDEFEVVRVKTVGKAVALALGAEWSPAIGQMVRAALARMGGRLILHAHRHLVAGIRPRHFDRADAVKLSMELRGRKTPPREAA